MLFSLSNVNAHIFKMLFNILKNTSLVSISLCLNINEFLINNTDSSLTSIILCNLNKSFFETYNIDSDIKLGINVNDFVKILNCLKKDDNLNIDLLSGDKLEIILINSLRKQTFILPLLEIEYNPINIPDLEYDCCFQIKSSIYSSIISDISTVEGDDIEFKTVDKELIITSNGDIGETKININGIDRLDYLTLRNNTTNNNNKYIIDENIKNTKGKYSFKILEKITKACHITQYGPSIKIKNGLPLQIKFSILEDSSITLYIAPKI